MLFIGENDFTFTVNGPGDVTATYLPLGVSGHGDDEREAYKAMLRSIYATQRSGIGAAK